MLGDAHAGERIHIFSWFVVNSAIIQKTTIGLHTKMTPERLSNLLVSLRRLVTVRGVSTALWLVFVGV